MAITVVGVGTDTSGSSTGNGSTGFTLPSGIQNNDLAIGVIDMNLSNTGTFTLPTGWTELTGSPLVPGTTLEAAAFYKVCTAADSGTTVSVPSGVTPKWTSAVIVLRGADAIVTQATPTSDNSQDLLVAIPGITPGAADCMLVALGGLQVPVSPTGITPPTGWTEQAEVFTTVVTDPQVGSFIFTKQLVGQNGVAQASVNAVPASDMRDAVFCVAVSTAVADTTPPTISSVSHGTPGTTSATITWTTNEPATSKVGYSTTSGVYTTERPSPADTTADTTSHSVTLTGLSSSTTYFYRVTSADAAGNSANSSEGSFTTAAANTAPVTNAGPDQTGVEPFTTVTLDFSASSDADGNTPLTFAATQAAGTPTVTLSGTGATRTFTAPATLAGTTLTFSVTATDSLGLADPTPDTVNVTVLAWDRWIRSSSAWVATQLPKQRASGAWT